MKKYVHIYYMANNLIFYHYCTGSLMLAGSLSNDHSDPEDKAKEKSDLKCYHRISQLSIDLLELAQAKKVTSASNYKWKYEKLAAVFLVLQNT